MNYFSVCDTKFKWLKKCLFNFFECFPFLSVPSLDFSLFFMHKKTNLFLIHLVCKNLFQLLFAQPTVLSFVHDIISLAQHKYLVCRTYSWTSVSRISISCGYVICKSQSHLFKDTKVLLYYLICTIFSHSHKHTIIVSLAHPMQRAWYLVCTTYDCDIIKYFVKYQWSMYM